MIYKIIDYISIENAENLIKYIFDYLNDKEVELNIKEWDFCSYEYFENEMNSYRNIFYSSDFDINKEIKKENEKKEINIGEKNLNEAPLLLTSLFNYSLKDDKDFYIEYKSHNNINSTFPNELTLINKNLYKDRPQKNKEIKMTNLSFYKSISINDTTLITNDSLLLIGELAPDNELLKIVSENSEKIKAIIAPKKDDSKEEECNEFIEKIKIPIYLVSNKFYNKLIKFFLEGIGGTYLSSNKKIKKEESDIIPIYCSNHLINKNSQEEENDKKEENNFYMEENFCLDILFNEEADKEQIEADDMDQFKKEQKEFENFVKEIEQKKKDFELKKQEIIKTNEEIKKKLEKIKQRSEEIKSQTGELNQENK